VSEAAAAVSWLLHQTEPEARRIAVHQIAKVEGREACELLLRALGDDDWRVRKEAATVAPVLEQREETVATLVAALEDDFNIGLRNAAVEALVAIGPDAVGATIEALDRIDEDARKLAIEVLGGVPDARGTAALASALGDEDENVRAAAAEALGSAAMAGEESRALATHALASALLTSDAFLKIAALDSLARLDAQLPWSVFEPCAKDPLLRRYAIAAAAGSGEPAAVSALARATGDSSPTISREAIVALGDLIARGPDDDSFLDRVRADTQSAGCANARRAVRDAEDPRARGGALLILGLLRQEEDVGALAEALGDDEVAERADLALRLYGAAAAAPVLAAARAARPSVRAAALAFTASLEGANVAEVRAALREGLEDDSLDVVASAIEALGPLGDASDLRRVASLRSHADERVAATATSAVSEIAARHVDAARALLEDSSLGEDPLELGCVLLGAIASTRALDDRDVTLLKRALSHHHSEVRRAAVDALAQAGGDAAADAVVFALADEEHEVQLAAARALGRLRRPEALIGVVADTRDPVFAGTALRALGDADPARALASARPLVTHPDPAMACAAVEAIGQIAVSRGSGHPPANLVMASEDALFAALDHADPEVVKLALSLVGAEPGPRALARMGLCLDHSSWEVRRLAAELLGQDGGAGAEGLLRARYDREKDPTVRAAIGSAVSLRPPSDYPRSSEGSEGPGAERGTKGGH